METIPVVYLKKDFEKTLLPRIDLPEIKEKQGFEHLYIIDEEGITKNRPRFCFYQRFSRYFDLWIDAGPREIDDIVDDVFAGAKKIIIRPSLWTEPTIQSTRELTENEIYIAVEANELQQDTVNLSFYDQADGIIIFCTKPDQRISFKNESIINQIIEKKDVYVFDDGNNTFWQSKNVKGYLKDINAFV